MKSVGDILRNERLKQGLTALQIASFIKTKEKFILAIEENNFSVFPADVYALSYVRDYAEILGLNPDEVTPYFRRTVEINKKTGVKKTSEMMGSSLLGEKIDAAGRNISKTIFTFGTLLIVVIFISFLIFEYQRNILHPQLVIVSPTKDTAVSADFLKVSGKTDLENKIFINGEEVEIKENGEFQTVVPLKIGINKISIKAVNNYQKLTEIDRFVMRKN